MKVAVIGAGVIGLAIARELSLAGCEVTVIDRTGVGAGTSTTTFAWVNSNGKRPDSYYELNLQGLDEHVRLQKGTSRKPWFVQSGTYEWAASPDAADALDARVQRLRSMGYAVQPARSAAVAERVPLRRAPDGQVWNFPDEGYVHPQLLLNRLWSEAREHGTRLVAPCEVVGIDEHYAHVVLQLSDGGRWRCDAVVSATGRWSARTMSLLGLDLAMIDAERPGRVGCGFLAETTPTTIGNMPVLITPNLNLRLASSGGLLLQAPDLDDGADPNAPEAVDGRIAHEMGSRMRALLAGTETMRIERVQIGQRARPADGLPALGRVSPRVYLAVAHSGVTLALVIGGLVARELRTGERPTILREYDPSRLLGRSPGDFPQIPSIHFPAAQ